MTFLSGAKIRKKTEDASEKNQEAEFALY